MNKSVVLVLCIVFTLAVLVSSCSKPLDQPGFNGFRCAFGLKEWIADTVYYKKGIGTTIYANKSDGTYFQLFLETADTTGNFTLDSIKNTAYYFDGTTKFRSISGSANISEFYNDSLATVYGSFNFNGRVPGSSGQSLNFTYGYWNDVHRVQ